MQYAKAYYKAISGRVEVKWEREEEEVKLDLTDPSGAKGFVIAPRGYGVNGQEKVKAASGSFVFSPSNKASRQPIDIVFNNCIARRIKKLWKNKTRNQDKNTEPQTVLLKINLK